MYKKFKIFAIATAMLLLWNGAFVNAQVTIGSNKAPEVFSVLELISEKGGLRLPQMTTEQRDLLTNNALKENPLANGLLIYNIDEGCINSYDTESRQWNSICGNVPKSVFKINCDDVNYHGEYAAGTYLNSSHYLVVTLYVEKAGAYTVAVTTQNGYGFNSQGTFLNPGLQQIKLNGQGCPVAESNGDSLYFTINGAPYECQIPCQTVIPVTASSPTFSMNCVSVKVNGTYTSGVSLKPANTITLEVNVTALGNGIWNAETNTVDGIFFTGTGIFTSLGIQSITLLGHGTPTTASTKEMTVTVNSTGISKNCSATVNCVFPPKKIAIMGWASSSPISATSNDIYGYELSGNRLSYRTVKAAVNFSPTGTVKVQGLSITGVNSSNSAIAEPPSIGSRVTDATLTAALNNKPDIVVIGWGMIYSPAMIDAFKDYLNNGGVMIIMNKYTPSSNSDNSEAPLFRKIFGTNVTAVTIANNSGVTLAATANVGNIFKLAVIPSDPILNGPFGNLNGLLWGNDYYPAVYMTGIPEDQIITYSGSVNATNPNPSTGVTMFRHKTLNLFWVGDGGFICNEMTSGGTYSNYTTHPFSTDSKFVPVDKASFGSNVNNGGYHVSICNSRLFCNVLAWAIEQAEKNGINAGTVNNVVAPQQP